MQILKTSSAVWKKIKEDIIRTSGVTMVLYRKVMSSDNSDDPFIGETLPDRGNAYTLEEMVTVDVDFAVAASARLRNDIRERTDFGTLIEQTQYVAVALYDDVKDYYKEASHAKIVGWGDSDVPVRILGTYEDGYDEPFIVWFFLAKEV